MFRRSKLSETVRGLLTAATIAVSLSTAWAQDTAAARVIEMTGRVSILRDRVEWALSAGSSVQPKQVVLTGADGYAKFQLADGSAFEVFANSRVVFRANAPSFGDLLDVVIGRVKVYIQHRNGPNPNRVTTQTAVISVRGTVFDVVVEDEDATTLVSVDEGVVGVQHLILGGDTELHAGESVRVFRNQPLARRVDKGNVAQKALRVAAQAAYDVLLTRPGAGGGTSTGGGGTPTAGGTSAGGGTAPGDCKGSCTSGGGNAPAPPPPAAPPPPPPPPSSGH